MAFGSRIVFFAVLLSAAVAQHNPHFTQNRTTIVHLFEWRWNDIAEECERMLGPYGFGGVQTSPANENAVIRSGSVVRPWYERYQPVSYKLQTRSGTEEEFKSMVRRCNNAGVRVYVDVVINHMTGSLGTGTGTAGDSFDSSALNYPAAGYTSADFNVQGQCPSKSGNIEDYNNANQVRNCKLSGLHDLNQGKTNVRNKIVEFLNKLISYGVAGFRVDAAKHMWPADLKTIYDRLNNLNTAHGFPSGARAFIYQEVIGGGASKVTDYTGMGRVTEFQVCSNIGDVFRKWNNQQLRWLRNWGEGWAFLADGNALAFVDNHDNQRGHGAGGDSILSFKTSKLYKMAQAFTLAWPYGVTRIMSSFYWTNDYDGPPHDNNYNILPVTINSDFTCGNGWVCEHRWRQIYNMVRFRNAVKGTAVNNWWDNQGNQIAFSRGNKGFIAINNDAFALQATIQTGLAGGRYCDVLSGNLSNGACTGKVITVASDGKVTLNIPNDSNPMVAIHVNAKL